MQAETRTADQLVRVQRSELNAALSDLSGNRSATSELYGRFAALEQAQASATAECRWLNSELRAHAVGLDAPSSSTSGSSKERFVVLTQRFDEFQTTVEQTLSDVQACVESYQERMRVLENGLGMVQTENARDH